MNKYIYEVAKWCVIITFFSSNCFGQLSVDFPKTRIVFQRNNNNTAYIEIAGTYSIFLDKIEARVVPFNQGQGLETNWVTIADNPTTGNFHGGINATGGWYRLEVRGFKNNQIAATTHVDRVGVGEVFIYAGQSNAEGSQSYPGGSTGATDERVCSINYSPNDGQLNEDALPFDFDQLNDNKRVAPYNSVPWYWGRLGDRIVRQYNVPVLFYGAALGGSSSAWWSRSANGEDLRNEFPIFIKSPGMPFRAIEAALQRYASRTGVRAILWHQGESDSQTSPYQYFLNMNTVIKKSRDVLNNQNLAWMIARASRQPETYSNVIEGQNLTINTVANTFAGPSTDFINGPGDRFDGIHFQLGGLDKAADAWLNAINQTILFQNSTPIMPQRLLPISISCNPSSSQPYQLQTPSGYNFYQWSSGQGGNAINSRTGAFSVKAKNAAGVVLYSPTVYIEERKEIPSVSARGETTFCSGSSLELFTNYSDNLSWNNGNNTQTIRVSQEGAFLVNRKNIFGCLYTSNAIYTTVVESPKPIITATNSTTFCDGGFAELRATQEYLNYTWSNSAKTKTINATKAGSYQLSVSNQSGCIGTSNTISVTVLPLPEVSIINDQNNIFCEGSTIELKSSGLFAAYSWNTGEGTPTIQVGDSKEVTLNVLNNFGCKSKTATITVSKKSKPTQPIIQQISPFSIALMSSKQEKSTNQWWVDENILSSAKDTIKVNTSGNYRLKLLNTYPRNGLSDLVCESEYSSPLTIKVLEGENSKIIVFPNPVVDGSISLESSEAIDLIEFSLYNSIGITVKSGKIENLTKLEKIDVSNLPQGLYILKLRSSRKSIVYKLSIIN